MLCPSCGVTIAFQPANTAQLGMDPIRGILVVRFMQCPACQRAVVTMSGQVPGHAAVETVFTWPRSTGRQPCPGEVPENIRAPYEQACLVMEDSPMASAALSRRCLQHILRESAGVKAGTLAAEIDQVLNAASLPTLVAEGLDAVREIGNFAAHPTKSTSTGEIIDVEPGEAEWNLDVVEALMDIYYVQPVRMAAKKAALNRKLGDAGKNPV